MAMHAQILWGSFYLALCCLLHVGFLAVTVETLHFLDHKQVRPRLMRVFGILLGSFLAIVAAHTTQVWLWAWALQGVEQLQDWNSAVYFSLVTYTSLGYGDLVLGPGARIFGAFASVAGLLSFGMSTAFLVALMSRMLKGWIS